MGYETCTTRSFASNRAGYEGLFVVSIWSHLVLWLKECESLGAWALQSQAV